jgi:hypothetical protein
MVNSINSWAEVRNAEVTFVSVYVYVVCVCMCRDISMQAVDKYAQTVTKVKELRTLLLVLLTTNQPHTHPPTTQTNFFPISLVFLILLEPIHCFPFFSCLLQGLPVNSNQSTSG